MKLDFSNITPRKIVIIAIAAAILVAAAIVVVYQFSKPGIIKEAEVNISADARDRANNDLREAESTLASLPEHATLPERIDLMLTKAKAQHTLGKYLEAKTTLQEAIKLDGGRRDLWFALFKVERDMKDYQAAEKSIQTALFVNDQVPEYWEGYLALRRDDLKYGYDDMEKTYTEALFRTGFHHTILASYADFLAKYLNFTTAASYYRQALEKDPDNSEYQKALERAEAAAVGK